MIHEITNYIFSFLCHQEPMRCWAPGGNVLTLCQRCTGVYVGAAMMLPLLPLMKFKSNNKILWIHGFFMLQMLIFGFHLIPHSAMIRTLSGQIFITGAFYFLWHNIQDQRGLSNSNSPPKYYFLGIAVNLLLLQLLVHTPLPFISTLIEILAFVGLLTIAVLSLITIADLLILLLPRPLKQKVQ